MALNLMSLIPCEAYIFRLLELGLGNLIGGGGYYTAYYKFDYLITI